MGQAGLATLGIVWVDATPAACRPQDCPGRRSWEPDAWIQQIHLHSRRGPRNYPRRHEGAAW